MNETKSNWCVTRPQVCVWLVVPYLAFTISYTDALTSSFVRHQLRNQNEMKKIGNDEDDNKGCDINEERLKESMIYQYC